MAQYFAPPAPDAFYLVRFHFYILASYTFAFPWPSTCRVRAGFDPRSHADVARLLRMVEREIPPSSRAADVCKLCDCHTHSATWRTETSACKTTADVRPCLQPRSARLLQVCELLSR